MPSFGTPLRRAAAALARRSRAQLRFGERDQVKKIIRRVLGAIAALVLLAIVGAAREVLSCSRRGRVLPRRMTAPASPEALERGKYLVNHVAACIGCHSPVQEDKPGDPPVEGRVGAGRDFGDWGPDVPFHLRAPNLTPDKETGIGAMTDGEIDPRDARGHRQGRSRALPADAVRQTYAQTLSDDDALAIVAYLRTLTPIKNDPGAHRDQVPGLDVHPRRAEAARRLTADGARPVRQARARQVAPRRLLVPRLPRLGRTARCRSSPARALAGGMKFPLPDGKGVAVAPNITTDKATGIGAYSDDDLRRVFDEGKGKTGRYPLHDAVVLLQRHDQGGQGGAHCRASRGPGRGRTSSRPRKSSSSARWPGLAVGDISCTK